MSQFPGQPPLSPIPYEPPRLGDGRNWPLPTGQANPSGRASLLLIILGALALAIALLLIGFGRFVPDELMKQSQANWPSSAGPKPNIAYLRMALFHGGAALAIIGAILISLGIAVRRGGRSTAMIAIASSGMAILWLLWIGASVVVMGGASSGAACGLCMILPALLILGTVIRSLLQSLAINRQLSAYYAQSTMQQPYQQFQTPAPPPPSDPNTMPDYTMPPQSPPSPPKKP